MIFKSPPLNVFLLQSKGFKKLVLKIKTIKFPVAKNRKWKECAGCQSWEGQGWAVPGGATLI